MTARDWFAGRVVLITGASSGLGAEMARQLTRRGARVGLVARREARLQALAADIESTATAKGGCAVAYAACDVENREQTLQALRRLEEQLGPVDLLVANAGMGLPQRVERFDADKAAQNFRVNVFGVMNAIEAVLPGMLARRCGHIVGISSVAAFRSFPENHSYCASKSAVSALLEGLRMELYAHGIDVTTVCPGFVRTELTATNRFPMPFLMDAEPAVRRILRAVVRKKRVYIFPLRLYLLLRMSRLIPERILATLAFAKIDAGKDPRQGQRNEPGTEANS